MEPIGIYCGLLSFCMTVCKAERDLENALKVNKKAGSFISDNKTWLDTLSKELESFRVKVLEADQILPQHTACGEQSGGKSSALEVMYQQPFPREGITGHPYREQLLMRRYLIQSHLMNLSSSTKCAEAPCEMSCFARELGSPQEVLYEFLRELMYKDNQSAFIYSAKRVFPDTYDTMSPPEDFAMQPGQLPPPRYMVARMSLPQEALKRRYLDVEWPCSYTQNARDISRNAFIVFRAAKETPIEATMRLIRRWEQLNARTRSPSRTLLLLGRFGTLLPEPVPSDRQPHHLRTCGDGGYTPQTLLDKLITEISDPFVGDEWFGPDAGEPNMGREEDDDDDCVGFRRFAGVENRAIDLPDGEGGRDWSNTKPHLPVEDLRAITPKFGPPKRDPVSAAIGRPVQPPMSGLTQTIWRDAIASACGVGKGFGSIKAKKWKELSCHSSWIEMYGGSRGEGGILCAH